VELPASGGKMTGSSAGKISWPGWVARDLVLIAVLGALSPASPSSRPSEQSPESAQPNYPSKSPSAASADQQAQSTKDRELARKIRRSVVTDKSLSIRAHNIKIIAKNGTVTLRGAVRSDQEKNAVTAKAIQLAGANNVKDEISVKRKG
jgi:hyperosmotically inducible periplasmic protein